MSLDHYFHYYTRELSKDGLLDSERLHAWYVFAKDIARRAPHAWIEKAAGAWILDYAVEGEDCDGLGPKFEQVIYTHPELYSDEGRQSFCRLDYDWMMTAGVRDHLLELITTSDSLRGRLEFLRRLLCIQRSL
jgi:hypothetical protein